jgi:hypothetical protein
MESTNTSNRDLLVVSGLVAVIVFAVTQSFLFTAIVVACGLLLSGGLALSRQRLHRRDPPRARRG